MVTPSLFPPTSPRALHYLDVGDGHELYVEECGNPQGIPVVFLHGGPGAGVNPLHRRLFDPQAFRIILYDQRGAGQSRPFAHVHNNTTWHLIADLERIRQFFGIEKWLVFGGSWGSTLGLVYGISHSERCLGFILRGIFLGTKSEIDWFLQGMRHFFPEAWQHFIDGLDGDERRDILKSYHRLLMSNDENVVKKAAEHWGAYENSCATLKAELREGGELAVSLARLEAHYFINNCFLAENFIMNNIGAIRHLPSFIVQGRHDVICPPQVAYNLANIWDGAKLEIVDTAGHSTFEPDLLSKLLLAVDRMKEHLLG